MVGKGIDSKNTMLENLCTKFNISGKTMLLGERHDVPNLLNAMDIVVSSSLGEGFPNIIGEAMSCGVPCVVTDTGESAFLVSNTGIVVKPGDAEGLAKGITTLLSLSTEEREKLGLTARKRIENEFEISMISKKVESIYEELYKNFRSIER